MSSDHLSSSQEKKQEGSVIAVQVPISGLPSQQQFGEEMQGQLTERTRTPSIETRPHDEKKARPSFFRNAYVSRPTNHFELEEHNPIPYNG